MKKGLIVKQGEEPFQVVRTVVRSQRKRDGELSSTNEPSTTRLYGEVFILQVIFMVSGKLKNIHQQIS